MKGLIADANIQGQVEYLVRRMQADAWAEFWETLGLVLRRFEDVGLSESSTDYEVWNVCQAEQLILITDNRNLDSEHSLEATIRRNNTPASLPVLTIADMSESDQRYARCFGVLEDRDTLRRLEWVAPAAQRRLSTQIRCRPTPAAYCGDRCWPI